jgi:hypothetical protein
LNYLTATAGSNSEGDPGPQKNSTASKKGLIAGAVSCVAVLGFLAVAGTFVWRQKKKRFELEMEGKHEQSNC